MKAYNLSLLVLALSIVSVSCEREANVSKTAGKASGVQIGMSADVYSPVTKASNVSENITVIENDGYSMTVKSTVEPYQSEVETKASAMDRDGLKTSGFWVRGYLGPEYAEYEYDKDSYFITGIHASHFDTEPKTEIETDATDRWEFDTPQQWRDRLDHYFWAYYPNLGTKLTTSTDGASITGYTSPLNEDVLVAYANKYWDYNEICAEGDHDGDYLNFTFNHALAAVDFKYNITLKQQDKNGDAIANNGRLTILSASVDGIFREGDCDITTGGNFTWKNQASKDSLDIPNNLSFFVPQLIDSKSVTFYLRDNKREIIRPIQFDIPTSMSKTTDEVTSWDAGKKYTYEYNGNIVAPYVDPDEPGGYDPGFQGSPWQAAAPIGTLNFSYIKDLTITWTNIPGSNNKFQEVYIIITDKEIPTTPGKGDRPEITGADDKKDELDDVVPGDYITLLSTTSDNNNNIYLYPEGLNQGIVLSWRESEGEGTWNKITATGGTAFASTLYDIKINLDAETLGLDGDQYIYLVYVGGDESPHMKWIIENFAVTIDSRR